MPLFLDAARRRMPPTRRERYAAALLAIATDFRPPLAAYMMPATPCDVNAAAADAPSRR